MNDTLPSRILGSTGLEVSTLGLGTVKFGRNSGVKYPNQFDLPDDEQIRQLLAQASDHGMNLLDTAPAYGSSEERLGSLLNNRKHWVICSKTGEEFTSGESYFDFSAQHTRASVERSLRRLQTDYLDIVLVHSDGNDLNVINESDCLETLARLKETGHIRSYGFSGKTVAGGLRALELSDIVMVTLNTSYQEEIPVIEHARALNKGVLIKKAFASGHAVLKGQPSQTVQQNLRAVLEQPGVSSAICGTINPQHLEENIAAAIQIG
ncbi:aldo/keto reductase [Pseudohongiella nitratireducens]|nr:aldo/keto reductase [Pseudohongiella nitratireducens]MDF1622158.1 aldo/keto reductase [Pseudohongiella nitratireducens]